MGDPVTPQTQPAGTQAGAAPQTQASGVGGQESEQQSRSKLSEANEQYKAENLELKRSLAKFQTEAQKAEEKRLAEAGEHQKLAALKSQEAEAFKAKYEGEKKQNALLAAGQKAGLRNPAYLKLVDLSGVTLDGDDVKGADEAIAALRKQDESLFGPPTKNGTPFQTPAATPGGALVEKLDGIKAGDVHKLSQAAKQELAKRGGTSTGGGGFFHKG